MTVEENKIIVKDNYLPDNMFEPIRNYFMGNQCYWYFNGNYSGGYPQMEHTFHNEVVGTQKYPGTPMVASYGMDIMQPILDSFQYAALIRIRAICNWKTGTMTQREWHVDVPFDCTTAIYYLHDSDGCTLFQDGDNEPLECETKANRLVKFPSQYYHSVTPFTTPYSRSVINFNYIESKSVEGVKLTHNISGQHPMS